MLQDYQTSLTTIKDISRSSPRVPIRIKVDFTSDDKVQSVVALNISAGGIYLATHKPLPPGSMVIMKMNLPNLDGAVEVLGEVVWNNPVPDTQTRLPEGMGIRFLNADSLVKEMGNFYSGRMGNS